MDSIAARFGIQRVRRFVEFDLFRLANHFRVLPGQFRCQERFLIGKLNKYRSGVAWATYLPWSVQ